MTCSELGTVRNKRFKTLFCLKGHKSGARGTSVPTPSLTESGGNADKELNAASPLLKHLMCPNCRVCTLAVGVTPSKRRTFIFKYSSRRGCHIYIYVSTSALNVPSYLSLRGAQETAAWRSRPATASHNPCASAWIHGRFSKWRPACFSPRTHRVRSTLALCASRMYLSLLFCFGINFVFWFLN